MKFNLLVIRVFQIWVVTLLSATMLVGCQQPAQTATVVLQDSSHIEKPAVSETEGDSAKAVLARILLAVDSNQCNRLAPLVAYRSIDGSGDYKRGCDYLIPDERVQVDKMCAQLSVIKAPSDVVTILEYSFEEQKEGYWHVLQTMVHHENGDSSEVTFALIEANGALLLGDID